MDTIIDQTSYMIDTMVGLGIMICIASVYVAVNMLVSENRSNISMLKVLGVSGPKDQRIVLGSNRLPAPGNPHEYSCRICFLRTVFPDVCRYDGDAGQPVSGA